MENFDIVKVGMPLPSPGSDVIEEINEELVGDPGLLDSDPYDEGWLALFSLADFTADRQNLANADVYRARSVTTKSP